MSHLSDMLDDIAKRQQSIDEKLTAVLSHLRNNKCESAEAEWISIKQAASLAGISETSIRRAIRRGQLKACNVGGSSRRPTWRIKRTDLQAFLETDAARSSPPKPRGKYRSRHFSDL